MATKKALEWFQIVDLVKVHSEHLCITFLRFTYFICKLRYCVRTLKNVHDGKSRKEIVKELQIMTLPCLYVYCCLLRKYIIRENVPSQFTRRIYMRDQRPVRLGKSVNTFIYMKIQLFQKLPERARIVIVDISKIQTELSKWLNEKVLDSVEDQLISEVLFSKFLIVSISNKLCDFKCQFVDRVQVFNS